MAGKYPCFLTIFSNGDKYFIFFFLDDIFFINDTCLKVSFFSLFLPTKVAK